MKKAPWTNGGPFGRSRARWLAGVASLIATSGAMGCHEHPHPHPHDDKAAHAEEHPHDEAEDGHHDAHDHDDEHAHAPGAVGITKWTDTLELFAEHPPAVTGAPLPFLAHLTILDSFAPVEEATVTLQLTGPAPAAATAEAALRPGIFRPTLTAPKPGRYAGRLIVKGPRVDEVIDGFEIEVHESAEDLDAPDEERAQGISFLKEQQWKVPFGTAFARQGELTPTIEVGGEIDTPPSGQAVVGAPVAGRVVAPKAGLPRPGQRVAEGTLLATVAPAPTAPEDRARAELAVVEAEARLDAATKQLARAERLLADQALSERAVEDARREARVAKESVEAARRARAVFSSAAGGGGAGSYRLTAPIDGVVVDVDTTAGHSVQRGDHLFHVVNLSELWVVARVPEQEAGRIRGDRSAAFSLPGLDEWLPIDVDAENAAVVDVGRTVDPRSRTVRVIYALREPDPRLRVGAMVRVAVPAGDPWTGVVVPASAVLEDDGRALVYVQTEGERFEERAVRLGPRSGDRVGVARGVEAGERVVTTGARVVHLVARAGSAPAHGHVH